LIRRSPLGLGLRSMGSSSTQSPSLSGGICSTCRQTRRDTQTCERRSKRCERSTRCRRACRMALTSSAERRQASRTACTRHSPLPRPMGRSTSTSAWMARRFGFHFWMRPLPHRTNAEVPRPTFLDRPGPALRQVKEFARRRGRRLSYERVRLKVAVDRQPGEGRREWSSGPRIAPENR
jgi:hypothetical protein